CKIKKTTDGRRCGAFGEARKTLQIIAQRCFARDVQINEQSGAAQNGQDQAQGKTDQEEAALKICGSFQSAAMHAHCFCTVAIDCLKGSKLTLLVPVKGW